MADTEEKSVKKIRKSNTKKIKAPEQDVGPPSLANTKPKKKPGKKIKTPKQDIESQLIESNRDEQDSNNVIGASMQEIEKKEPSSVVKRLQYFVNTFIHEFAEKLDNYTGYISSSRKNQSPKQLSDVTIALNMIPKGRMFAYGCEYFIDKNCTSKATEIIKRLEDDCKVFGADLERTVIRVGCTIFANFEQQIMALEDGQLQDFRALATVAVERIMNCLSTYVNPERHELSPTGYSAFLYRCFLEGKSKGLIENFFPQQTVRQNKQEIKLSDVFKKVGLAIVDKGKIVVYLKKKNEKSNTRKYGYRLCSIEEWNNYQHNMHELYEVEPKSENFYEYLLRPDDIQETEEMFFRENPLKETFFVKHTMKILPLPWMKSKM